MKSPKSVIFVLIVGLWILLTTLSCFHAAPPDGGYPAPSTQDYSATPKLGYSATPKLDDSATLNLDDSATPSNQADWLGTWKNRIAISIDHNELSSTLVDFPLKIHLSSSSGIGRNDVTAIFAELGSDSSKMAVTTSDGMTQCYVEIARWDTSNKQAILYTKVPSISASTDTTLYLYYDSTQPDNFSWVGDVGSQPGKSVWDSNFVAVWHLTEQGNGTTGEYRDSTGNWHSGTAWNNNSSGAPARVTDNVYGYAQTFDGVDDAIEVTDSAYFSQPTTGYVTVSWWFKPTVLKWTKDNGNSEHYLNMLGKGGTTVTDGWEYYFTLGGINSKTKKQAICFYVSNPAGGIGAGAKTYREDGNGNEQDMPKYGAGDWIYVTGRLDKEYVHITGYYPDGYSYISPETNWTNYRTYPQGAITPANTRSPFSIGTMPGQGQMFEGIIGEVRVSNSYRSDDWIKASYCSESDKLLNLKNEVRFR